MGISVHKLKRISLSRLRNSLYAQSRKYGSYQFKRCGKNVLICDGCVIESPEKLSIGDGVYIGPRSHLSGEIVIDDGVVIAQEAIIWASMHDYLAKEPQAMPFDEREKEAPIHIGKHVWIGAHEQSFF